MYMYPKCRSSGLKPRAVWQILPRRSFPTNEQGWQVDGRSRVHGRAQPQQTCSFLWAFLTYNWNGPWRKSLAERHNLVFIKTLVFTPAICGRDESRIPHEARGSKCVSGCLRMAGSIPGYRHRSPPRTLTNISSSLVWIIECMEI